MKSPRRYTTRKKHKTTSVRVPRQEQVKEKSKTSEEPTEESKSTEVNVQTMKLCLKGENEVPVYSLNITFRGGRSRF